MTMRRTVNQQPVETDPVNSADYLKGYRDGQRDSRKRSRALSGDGILGAVLALTLLAGVAYAGYNYAVTGQVFPAVDLNNLSNPLPAESR